MRIAVKAILWTLIALPTAIFLTFALTPFWSWLEATYGIESLGHSGPSDWCFLAVYGLILLVGAALALRRWRVGRQE